MSHPYLRTVGKRYECGHEIAFPVGQFPDWFRAELDAQDWRCCTVCRGIHTRDYLGDTLSRWKFGSLKMGQPVQFSINGQLVDGEVESLADVSDFGVSVGMKFSLPLNHTV